MNKVAFIRDQMWSNGNMQVTATVSRLGNGQESGRGADMKRNEKEGEGKDDSDINDNMFWQRRDTKADTNMDH